MSRIRMPATAALLTSLAIVVSPLRAADLPQRDAVPLVVESAWLAEHVDDADLVVLHVGNAGDYEAGHVPGARLVALSDLSGPRDGKNTEMLPPEVLHDRLESLGISDASRIVVYFANGNRVTASTRIMLTLDYAGLGRRTSLLNGGLDAWTAHGRELVQTETPVTGGSLEPLTVQPIVVTAEDVRTGLETEGTVIVDARAAAFYDGTNTGGGRESPHRTGHITGALSIPFNTVFDEELRLLDTDALRARFDEAGVEPGATVIGYCHIGQQVTAMLFAARVLGHPVRLYDGSFEDWSSREDYPVTNPSGGR